MKFKANPWPCRATSSNDVSVWSSGSGSEVTMMGGCWGFSIFVFLGKTGVRLGVWYIMM